VWGKNGTLGFLGVAANHFLRPKGPLSGGGGESVAVCGRVAGRRGRRGGSEFVEVASRVVGGGGGGGLKFLNWPLLQPIVASHILPAHPFNYTLGQLRLSPRL